MGKIKWAPRALYWPILTTSSFPGQKFQHFPPLQFTMSVVRTTSVHSPQALFWGSSLTPSGWEFTYHFLLGLATKISYSLGVPTPLYIIYRETGVLNPSPSQRKTSPQMALSQSLYPVPKSLLQTSPLTGRFSRHPSMVLVQSLAREKSKNSN